MEKNFLSVYKWNKYKEAEVVEKSYVSKESFIDLFLSIDWSLGTIHTYPNYPNDPRPKNHLFVFDIETQKSMSFDIVVSNDWMYEFILDFGEYQEKDKNQYHGTIESMETSCFDEKKMLSYIEDFFNKTYTSIKKLKQEAGVSHSHESIFRL